MLQKSSNGFHSLLPLSVTSADAVGDALGVGLMPHENSVLRLSETAAVLDIILRMVYGFPQPIKIPEASYSAIAPAMGCLLKYGFNGLNEAGQALAFFEPR